MLIIYILVLGCSFKLHTFPNDICNLRISFVCFPQYSILRITHPMTTRCFCFSRKNIKSLTVLIFAFSLTKYIFLIWIYKLKHDFSFFIQKFVQVTDQIPFLPCFHPCFELVSQLNYPLHVFIIFIFFSLMSTLSLKHLHKQSWNKSVQWFEEDGLLFSHLPHTPIPDSHVALFFTCP